MATLATFTPRPLALALAACLSSSLVTSTWAQQTTSEPIRLEPITVSAKAAPVLDAEEADVGGFDASLAKTPQSITVIGADLIAATAMQNLSQALRLDASMSDNYNTPGFIENLTVRGFMLEHIGNYRRNGLAVSNYMPLAFENKERLEVLKGVAGLQSGVSAPGGLINYVTKQPQVEQFTTVLLSGDQRGSAKAHVDANTQVGTVGLRLNVAAERLRSYFDGADGDRQFASLALSAPLSSATRLTADFEYHRKSQPSVPGLGLLDRDGDGIGETLPEQINQRLNLNNQSWTLPFQTRATTAQVALEHQLSANWSGKIGVSAQQSRIDDRIAFPDGCSNSDGSYVYPGLCGNGDVDIYDFRSENEKRRLWSWDAQLNGHFTLGNIGNSVRFGSSGYNAKNRPPALQAYNWVGTTNIYHPIALPEDPSLTTKNTYSDDKAADIYATLSTQWTPSVQSFAGLRSTRLSRHSERSDGSRNVSLEQTVTTPWFGLTYALTSDITAYASWGQGVELEVTPNRADKYVNYGEVLPALKSKQTEVGAKWQVNPRLLFSTALFSIDKPFGDEHVLSGDELPTRFSGGKEARHRGLEVNAAGRVSSNLSLQASATWLDAKYTRAVNGELIGKSVTNVPRFAASLFADYKITAVPGLSLSGLFWLQDGKKATDDGATELPRAWQLDAGVRYQHQIAGRPVQWRLNVENLTNRVYWREAAPTYWGGVYLFASAPRTVRASVSVDF